MITKSSTRFSWFFNTDTCALFVGKEGQAYPGSNEVCPCTETPSVANGEKVVMEHIAPYKEFMAGLQHGITIYYKGVW